MKNTMRANALIPVLSLLAVAVKTPALAANAYEKSTLRHLNLHGERVSRRSVYGGEGTVPEIIGLHLSWPKNGRWFEIATSDPLDKYMNVHRVSSPGIRFTDLRSYAFQYGPPAKGVVFQVPHSYFVGRAIEGGRPVTFVWEANEKPNEYDPVQSLKVFDGDAHQIGSKRLVVEHAKANWIPRPQWPKGASRTTRLARDWQEKSGGGFKPGSWRIL